MAVQMINNKGECLAAEGALVDEVRRLIASNDRSTVQYVSRSANGAAHRIARFTLYDNGLSF
ncbi:unnamed protein product [Prunus armeniaca]|uniref:RNase H type-1 domain-containing protein n=1 Tax=Prunus armeniaca TaxID=36596 RepID=A0A6J5TGM2_PRUAR|nr:unnamed protein product [Prunus armeniaca]